MGPYTCTGDNCGKRTDNDSHLCDECELQAEADAQREEDEANYNRMIGESLRRHQ